MTESQRLQIKMSQTRDAANDETTTDSDRTRLLSELRDLEVKFRTALEAEVAQVDGDFAAGGQPSAEFREMQEITRRADLGTMMANVISRRNQTGAEAEALVAWDLEGNQIPLSMIAEIRTVAAPTDGGGTQPVSGYVFPASIASFANIARPTVPAGTPVFPSIVTGAVAGRPTEGSAHGSSEPTLRGELLTPKRIQAVASVSVEDRARYPSLGPALAAHLAGAVAAGMDTQALSDTGGFFDTVAASRPLTTPSNPGSATTYAQWQAILAKVVDGRHAANLAGGGLLLHPDAFEDAEELYRGNQSSESFAERIARVSRMQVSAAMPATASNISNVLIVRGSSPGAVQPTWPGLTIEDIYTNSGSGEISFTAVAMSAFSVTHPSAYEFEKIHNG